MVLVLIKTISGRYIGEWLKTEILFYIYRT